VVCLWDKVVPEWVFGLLKVEVYGLKIYGKYDESRQHSCSARKREGIALLLLLKSSMGIVPSLQPLVLGCL